MVSAGRRIAGLRSRALGLRRGRERIYSDTVTRRLGDDYCGGCDPRLCHYKLAVMSHDIKSQLGLLKAGLVTLDGRRVVQPQLRPPIIVVPQELF